jgi:hypothetical protein
MLLTKFAQTLRRICAKFAENLRKLAEDLRKFCAKFKKVVCAMRRSESRAICGNQN